MRTHNDPEFVTFTYGDFPTTVPRASNLQRLECEDQLFFLARLVRWSKGNFTSEAGFYLIGFLDIEHVYDELELSGMVQSRRFGSDFEKIRRNGHMIHARDYPEVWLRESSSSWVFKGSDKSKRFRYAVPFDRALAEEIMLDARGNELKWPENQTELQRIGSYTRSCRIIENQDRIDRLWKTIRSYSEYDSTKRR
jgi:hypothetical protein